MKIEGVKLLKNGTATTAAYDITIEDGRLTKTRKTTKLSGNYLAPAYVDIHTHGAMGVDFSTADEEGADAASMYYMSHGITHFCPTFVATPLETLEVQLERLFSYKPIGANMLPAHIEGPYISIAHKGAQPAENIQTVFKQKDCAFFSRNKDRLKIVTLCPATENAVNLTKCLTENGIKAQGGHDDSNIHDINACIAEGLDGVTHIYCGCSSSVRNKDFDKFLGLTECGLLYDKLTVEVIADDKHISKELFELILKCKGFRGICLVSDSLSCAGMPKGLYKLGEQDVYTDERVCYLADGSSLAGSVTSVDEMVKILIGYGVPLAHAVHMAAETPRHYLNMREVLFWPNEYVDYNLLDKDGNVLETFFKKNPDGHLKKQQ